MKAKLIKENNFYYLKVDGKIIADIDGHPLKSVNLKLSKQNCDEIFKTFSIEEIAVDRASHFGGVYRNPEGFSDEQIGYLHGFIEGAELNKDKLFTEEQMWNMFYFGDSLKRKIKSGKIDNKPMGEIFNDYIKSLQQPTEMEVRIVMGCNLPNGCTEPDVECTCELTYNLDENGCLTLWVLNT
jgi:hypothetical protein